MNKFKLWVYFKEESTQHFNLEVRNLSNDKYENNSRAITLAEKELEKLGKEFPKETFEADLSLGTHKPVCWWEMEKGEIKILHNFNEGKENKNA